MRLYGICGMANIFFTRPETIPTKRAIYGGNPNLATAVDLSAGRLCLKSVILELQAELIKKREKVRAITRRKCHRHIGLEGLATPTMEEMLAAASLVVAVKPQIMISLDEVKPLVLSAL